MSRRLPTGKISPGRPQELVRLIVDYEDANDFLDDYAESLALGTARVQAERVVEPATRVQLGFSFPGLIEPLVVEGLVRAITASEDGLLTIELIGNATSRLATLVQRIRDRDRRVVSPVIKVLIVEDNTHVSELVKNGLAASTRRELRDLAFTFETAENGAVALELLQRTTFDAAIVDVYLPVLDGTTLIRMARTTLGLSKLPIIGLSGGGEVARDAALRAGASVFLDKPIRLRHIIETMRHLIAPAG